MKVKIKLLTEMLGTVTKDPEVYKTYIESKKPENQLDAEYLTVDKSEAKGWTGFHKNNNGELFIYDYMIKGFLKAAGNTLKEVVKVKNLRSKIDDFIFIFPRQILLGPTPDGVLERPLRAMTMQGPRVTLARSDYVRAGKELDFEITLVQHKEVTEDLIKTLLEHGRLMGLGQFRNGGYGRFEVLSIE